MPFSDQLRHSILNHVLGGSGNVNQTTLWIGLSRADPGFDGSTNSEPSGNAYARVAVVNSNNVWALAASGVKRNNAAITFPEATGSWGLVTDATLWTNATSTGASVFWGNAPLGTNKSIISGDTPNFPANSLSFTVNSSA